MTNVALVFFEESISELEFSNASVLTLNSTKAVKKFFKRTSDFSVVVFNAAPENYEPSKYLLDYLRNGLKNRSTRVVFVLRGYSKASHDELLIRLEADTVIIDTGNINTLLPPTIEAEIRSFQAVGHEARRREMEVEMLTTLGKLAQHSYSDEQCALQLSELITQTTKAHSSQVFLASQKRQIDPKNADIGVAEQVDKSAKSWTLVEDAIEKGCLQLCIDKTDDDHRRCSIATAASIALPLKCYDETLAVLHFLLPPESLPTLTVEFVELLGKLGEQTQILFERRASEIELRTQYDRVKSTLQQLGV